MSTYTMPRILSTALLCGCGADASKGSSDAVESVTLELPSLYAYSVSLSAPGDLDGDGLDDLVAVAGPDGYGNGGVFLFPGAEGGPDPDPTDQRAPTSGGLVEIGAGEGLGDLHGDGLGALALYARGTDDATTSPEIWVYGGSVDGLAEEPIERLDLGATWEGVQGVAMEGRRDYDGDGVGDLAVSSASAGLHGEALVFLGASGDPVALPAEGEGWGSGLGPVGDLTGDGYEDLLVQRWDEERSAFLFAGSPDGPDPSYIQVVLDGALLAVGQVEAMGDLDGDGYGDVAARASSEIDGIVLHRGTPDGLDEVPAQELAGPSPDSGLGLSMATLDLEGDGAVELLAGAPYVDWYQGGGLIYSTSGGGLDEDPVLSLGGGPEARNLGWDTLAPGDMDGDGRPEGVLLGDAERAEEGPVVRVFRFLAEGE